MANASSMVRPAVLSDLIPASRVRDVALVVGGAALTGLAAQLSFPGMQYRPALADIPDRKGWRIQDADYGSLSRFARGKIDPRRVDGIPLRAGGAAWMLRPWRGSP